jgi:N-acyl-D-aspartate/D-glutamate deacylase
MDLYPYVAGFTTLGWLFQHLFQRLPKPDSLFPTEDVESKAREVCIGGLSDVHILSHQDSKVAGRTISGVAASRGGEQGRVAQEIFLEDPNCLCIYDHESTPEAVDQLITHPKCFIGSDGFLFPTGFRSACHPRSFSTFVGFLVRYVRSGRLTLETGLSKLTGTTAEFFHLRDRGEIVVGRKANLTLFNLEELQENADFVNPCRPAEGIREVILAGQSIWRNNRVTGDSRAGQRACPVV